MVVWAHVYVCLYVCIMRVHIYTMKLYDKSYAIYADVCMYVCIHIHIHIYIYIYIHACKCMYACIMMIGCGTYSADAAKSRRWRCARMRSSCPHHRTAMYTHVRMYVSVYVRTHVWNIRACSWHAHTHTHTHTHTHKTASGPLERLSIHNAHTHTHTHTYTQHHK